MIDKTNDYSKFSLRPDNRSAINQSHVKRLIESIQAKNLLEMRPIIVNENMEIIDGQHRFLAAQSLGVEVYYRVEKKLNPLDIITLNVAKSWGIHDYMNFFTKNHYPEYLKLQQFMKQNNLQLRVAFRMTSNSSDRAYKAFKSGDYKFKNEIFAGEVDVCWRTINYIKRMNGSSIYTNTSKFWNPLLKLVKHPDFNDEKWMDNLSKMVERCTVKATSTDYAKMLMEINNWRNTNKVNLLDDEI